MTPLNDYQPVTTETLVEKTAAFKREGWRLVQISATRLADAVELTYSFDRDCRLVNIRLTLPDAARLPSISSIYLCAALYENEIHDLFNVPVDGMAIDFKGNFYKTTVKHPFASPKKPAAKPAAPVTATGTSPLPAAPPRELSTSNA